MEDDEKENILKVLYQTTHVEIDPELVELINKEGDFHEWIDEYSGYLCRIRRVKPYSCWCGYVRVPAAHNCSDIDYDDVNVEVHGGLTFGSNNFPDTRIYDKEYYWFGFDCGHSGDRIPYLWEEGTYRTVDYVKNECRELAKQLKDMEGC
jgi:hypothetical protein